MAKISIPFQEQFREAMLTGRKVLTSRLRRYGGMDDEFTAFGARFRIVSIWQMPLANVLVYSYEEEGFATIDEAWHFWWKIHPHRKDPCDSVWVHEFERIEATSPIGNP